MLRKHSRAASLALGLLVTVIGCSDAPVANTFGGNTALSVSPKIVDVDALSETIRLNVTANGGKGAGTPSVTWSSLDPSVATVNGNGEITSRSNGETRIVARSGEAADTARVRVNQKVAQISIGGDPFVKLDALGDTLRLAGVPQDRNGHPVPDATTTWQSLDPAIVMVTQNGLLSSKDNGNGKVVGKSGSTSDTVDVSVEQAAASLAVVPGKVDFTYLGEVATLTLDGVDKNGRPIRANGVSWSVSDPSVAEVDRNGVVTAVGNGTTTVQAKSGQVTTTAGVTVKQLITSVAVEPAALGVFVGQETPLEAAAYDAGGSIVPGTTTTWSSASTSIASVSNGKVKGVSQGSTTVLATIQGRSAGATVTVNQVKVGDISITPSSATILPGQTRQLTAAVLDGNGNAMTTSVTWSSSNKAVATVSAGLVTGVSGGSVTITASADGRSATSAITVTVPVASVKVTPTTTTLEIGKTVQIQATAHDANGNVLTGRTVTWSSSAPAIATVSSSGLVTAVKEGAATILASSEGKTASSSINVTAPEPPPATGPASVKLTQKVDSLDALNAKAQFKASAYDANGAVLSGETITWKSTNTNILTVTSNGEVTAKAVGTALIIAGTMCCDHADTTSVTVWQRPVTATVTPSSGTLKKGESLGLKATVYDRLGTAIPNAPISWISSKTSVATVNSAGTVTAVADGSATITARSSDASVAAAISVAATQAPPPPPTGVFFSDGFELGNTSFTQNTARWLASAGGVHNTRARSGQYSLRSRHTASQPAKDIGSGGTEARFRIAPVNESPYTKVWLEYYLYIPENHWHSNLGDAGEMKTLKAWTGVSISKGSNIVRAPGQFAAWHKGMTIAIPGAGNSGDDGIAAWIHEVIDANTAVLTGMASYKLKDGQVAFTSSGNASYTHAGFLSGAPTSVSGVTAHKIHRAGNHKLFALWGREYGSGKGDPKVYVIANLNPSTTIATAGDSRLSVQSYTAGYGSMKGIGDAAPGITGGTGPGLKRGQWNRVRVFVDSGTGPSKNDGVVRVWFGNDMVFNATGLALWPVAQDGAVNTPYPWWDAGYLNGWVNGGFMEDTDYHIDDFSIFVSSPGW